MYLNEQEMEVIRCGAVRDYIEAVERSMRDPWQLEMAAARGDMIVEVLEDHEEDRPKEEEEEGMLLRGSEGK
jgi:hypothetical protein